MKNLILFLALTFSFGITQATAQSTHAKKRIAQGVNSGELTKRETKQLTRQTRNLNKTKRVAKADGVVTKRERRLIKTKTKALNRNIVKQKHDRQSR